MNRSTNVDAKAQRGTTPMIMASRMQVANMIEELVEANANVNETDDSGKWIWMIEVEAACIFEW